MHIGKRLYVYFIAAVSLVMLGVGLTNLLDLAISEAWSSLRGTETLAGGDSVRQDVSLYTALTVVALPIWLIHWLMAERAVHQHDAERRSALRALYLAIVLFVPFLIWFFALRDLLERAVFELTASSSQEQFGRAVPSAIAALLIPGTAWVYHVWIRLRDERRGPIEERAFWPPRLYLYAACVVSLVMLLPGVIELLRLLGDLIFGHGDNLVGGRWWVTRLAEGLAATATGFAGWSLHWGFSLRRITLPDWRGESARRSTARRVYLYLATFAGVAVAVGLAARGLDLVFEGVLGVYDDDTSLAQNLVETAAIAAPFVLLWVYHRSRLTTEAALVPEGLRQASARRVYTYGASLISLVITAAGVARLLEVIIRRLGGVGTRFAGDRDVWREDFSLYAAIALAGSCVWLWHWYRAQSWAATDREEREAMSRRLYLYAALAGSVIAALVGLSIVVYRIFSEALGVETSGGFIDNISIPLGVFLTAAAVLVYHGLVLREQLAATGAAEAAKEAIPGEAPAGPAAPATLQLVLAGPPGADLDDALAELRAHLPRGYDLRPS